MDLQEDKARAKASSATAWILVFLRRGNALQRLGKWDGMVGLVEYLLLNIVETGDIICTALSITPFLQDRHNESRVFGIEIL